MTQISHVAPHFDNHDLRNIAWAFQETEPVTVCRIVLLENSFENAIHQ